MTKPKPKQPFSLKLVKLWTPTQRKRGKILSVCLCSKEGICNALIRSLSVIYLRPNIILYYIINNTL